MTSKPELRIIVNSRKSRAPIQGDFANRELLPQAHRRRPRSTRRFVAVMALLFVVLAAFIIWAEFALSRPLALPPLTTSEVSARFPGGDA